MDFLLQCLNPVMVGAFAILVLSYHLLLWRSGAGKSRMAPEASGAWPIIGHLHLLGGSKNLPHLLFGTMADKYGPVFSIRLGLKRAVVVSSWEMAKECFTTHDLALASRPELVAAKYLGYNYAMFAFSPHGAYWREVRKIATLELLSNRRLELLKNVRISEVETCMKELYKLWAEKKSEAGVVLVDMKQWFGHLSLNVILKMVVGKRYFGYAAESKEKEAQQCQKAIREFFRLLGLFVVSDALPFLGWLDVGGHVKAMKKTAKELDGIAQEWLEEHRRRKDSGEADGDQDFMDVMLSILGATDPNGYDADTINKATSLILIAGGTDTTSVTLTWAISLLLNNPHVLRKAQEELDTHVGKERLVNEMDISKLVYLQAIVKETLRLYPAAPLSGQRQFIQDSVLGGYHIPKGTRLLLNLTKIQRDPRVWLNPTKFQPSRFLTTYKDVDVKGKHFVLTPFGGGRRICPGAAFALQVLPLTLANFLHKFQLSTPSNSPIDMSESFGITNIKSTPLEVLISPRLASYNLYK
ncbi:cytochrome P450 CYP82D47 [Vitis vinifera]|uniref:Cytochrome P450 82A3 n=1 Tax=Vitis vinifera TaxID=29760 RepID=F6H019_VITVI|nr:cytochrome P450 CYP82D47 [Vitis vinifera]|eukprot:XP_019071776.1 PREDICTED: cytochrome P450 CYP82D47 [Vitis vinifera]